MKQATVRCLLVAAVAAVFTTAGTVAQAGTLSSVPHIQITTDDGRFWQQTAKSLQPYVVAAENRGYELDSELHFNDIWTGEADVAIKELKFDPDPFVLNNLLITNNTNVTQTYTVLVTLPTSFPAPNAILGAVTTAVIRSGSNDATVAAISGSSIYTALIDGSPVRTLQDAPFSLTAASPTITTALTDSFGPESNNTAVTSEIGIRLRFSLTRNSTAAIISRFDVIPEPATGLLLLMGAVVGMAFRRHR